jgi:hypothetical protein
MTQAHIRRHLTGQGSAVSRHSTIDNTPGRPCIPGGPALVRPGYETNALNVISHERLLGR